MATEHTFTLKILRGPPGYQVWEEFEFERKPALNIISLLMDIQRNPVTKQQKKTTPVAWESGCLEEVCGACTMLVNGVPRQSCSTIIEKVLEETQRDTITLAPLTKFPLVRDLIVDRSLMFENLKKVQAWVEADDNAEYGFGPKISPQQQELMYTLSCCFSCGSCLEACPQVNKNSKFIGAAAIAQAKLFNTHPVGKREREKRLHLLMEEGGVSECGNAQNCVKVCPKKLPLTDTIAAIGRDVTIQAVKNVFKGDS